MLDDLQKRLFELDELVTDEVLDSEDIARLAKEVLQARELVRVVRDISNRIEQGLARAMTEKKMVVEGVGVLERNVDVSRKNWDHKALASKLAAEAVLKHAQENGGELIDKSTAETFVKAFETACRMEWRVTGLGEYGIDADKYCDKEFGQPRVRITTPG
jgi:hypothetical protein